MRIGVLTSSRADFGIYLPLLKRLSEDKYFELSIIAFGTHLSTFHGETIQQIIKEGFEVKYAIESMLMTDSRESISTAIGLTTIKFAGFWAQHAANFDLIFCLGDRYEMFAAVTAGIAFNIPFAHLHGGETTLGAIDNVFRHAITLASKFHFVSTALYGKKVSEIIGSDNNIYYIGALGLENISTIPLLTIPEFKEKWHIDLSKDTILTTFHPETVSPSDNEKYAYELVNVIKDNPSFQFLITMPNADTKGNIVRKILVDELRNNNNVYLVENLGSQSYFTAMKYCSFLLGNTSSGIIEAASFGKYVINIGNRQEGRATSKNILQVPIIQASIQEAINTINDKRHFSEENIYFKKNSSSNLINILKQLK
ncbi:UDP-N-acetylglucosamine 2-epimerase [Pedobacter frigoris]|uniref:UDP-N-acetylglucosamine 2-epimerase (Hydrolyzing) n=1 Tax=Pedobacter frigoris TaxID=2571272 RepID=A0A4V5NYS5_9SPHI|nr:UDP-N-acetylglucosamine 2-epimerase [Pedobacter frigoris]TKC05259.1 UDP-N-acetylglucosamine 2-epimerase (hydrolyzing) [Pedobacter frigoris]